MCTAPTHSRAAASYHAGAVRWEFMCTTTRAAGARRAAAGGLHPPPTHGAASDACAAKVAAHSQAYERALVDGAAEEADWSEPVRRLPLRELVVDPAVVIFLLMHVLAAATPWWYGGVRRQDVVISVASYAARMFGITAGFHRLLSHRSYQTSRLTQFALAWLGTASLQKGPLWWASHHRHHHRTADTRADAHSPVVHGFWWSHCGWFLLTNRHAAPLLRAVPDLAALPELRFLERFYLLPPAALAACLYGWGGERAVAYGFVVATVLCWHATYAINSVAHLLGGRRFVCEFNGSCTARNNLVLALLTLGEGWHNNHHRFMASARHGFVQPYEIDVTFYVIKVMERVGLAWNLKRAPVELLVQARQR